jgi:hypothetical protein
MNLVREGLNRLRHQPALKTAIPLLLAIMLIASSCKTTTTTTDTVIPATQEPVSVSFLLHVPLSEPECDEQGNCYGFLTIDFEAKLKGGDEAVKITGVFLWVDGEVVKHYEGLNTTSISDNPPYRVPCGDHYVSVSVATSDANTHWSNQVNVHLPDPCVPPPPPPPPLQTAISLGIGVQCSCSGPQGGPYECGCTATVSYSVHLTGGTGDETISNVVLMVNGASWKTHNNVGRDLVWSESRPADCGQTLNAEVIVTLSDGSIHNNTGSYTTPNPCPD